MEIRVNDIDSRVLGGTVLELLSPSPDDDVAALERAYLSQYSVRYVVCKVPTADLRTIHGLEALGFRFIETQLRLSFTLRTPFEVPGAQYRFERVRDGALLDEVAAIAREAFDIDRWAVDPDLPDARVLAGRRYEAYLRASAANADDRVYALVDAASGRAAAVKSHRLTAPDEALMLLGGVRSEYRGTPVPLLAAYNEYNALLASGVRRIVTHVSARNHGVLNIELAALKYKVVETFAVLRKLYPA